MSAPGPEQAIIRIQFTGFWLPGTGASRGRHSDEVAHRDRDGWPAMPMSQVKGQLRETAERLADGRCAGWTHDRIEVLFGGRATSDERPRAGDRQGALSFQGDARLLAATRRALRDDPTLQTHRLVRRVAATRIGTLGVADDKTLRAVEAVVPATLEGMIAWIDAGPPDPGWATLLDAACAATLAFGKLKADGYGRATASLHWERSQ